MDSAKVLSESFSKLLFYGFKSTSITVLEVLMYSLFYESSIMSPFVSHITISKFAVIPNISASRI